MKLVWHWISHGFTLLYHGLFRCWTYALVHLRKFNLCCYFRRTWVPLQHRELNILLFVFFLSILWCSHLWILINFQIHFCWLVEVLTTWLGRVIFSAIFSLTSISRSFSLLRMISHIEKISRKIFLGLVVADFFTWAPILSINIHF